jgi:FMN-dependent dehydrogenase
MDFEECAPAMLPPHISAYYAAAAGSGVGLDEGTADWSAVRFRPRVLRDVGTASVSMTILGTSVRSCAASCREQLKDSSRRRRLAERDTGIRRSDVHGNAVIDP